MRKLAAEHGVDLATRHRHRRRRPHPQAGRPRRRRGGQGGRARAGSPPPRPPRPPAAPLRPPHRPSAAARHDREDVAPAQGHRRADGRVAAGLGPADHRRRGRRHPRSRGCATRPRPTSRRARASSCRSCRSSPRPRRGAQGAPAGQRGDRHRRRARSPTTTREHLGIAVDTERGLLVPVIQDAGDLNIAGLARKIADLAERTRTNKITPDELSGGTFTLTNTGSRGALFDTPIINQPQVAILGTGAVVKRPVVIDDADLGETIAIRSMVYLALTYDHRLVDGADAARFLTAIKAAARGRRLRGRPRSLTGRPRDDRHDARIAVTGSSGLIGTRPRRRAPRRAATRSSAWSAAPRARPTRCSWDPTTPHPRPARPRRRRRRRPPGRRRGRRPALDRRLQARDPRLAGRRHARGGRRRSPRPTTRCGSCRRSAVGFYGDRGDEELTEASTPGTGFLSDVVQAWEAATQPAVDAGASVVLLRTGIVMAPRGRRDEADAAAGAARASAARWARAGSTCPGSPCPTRSARSCTCSTAPTSPGRSTSPPGSPPARRRSRRPWAGRCTARPCCPRRRSPCARRSASSRPRSWAASASRVTGCATAATSFIHADLDTAIRWLVA